MALGGKQTRVLGGELPAQPSNDQQPRGWVVRLGTYLRIFGGRGNAGQPEHRAYIDRLAEMAKEREAEHGLTGLRVVPCEIEPLSERPAGGGDIPPSEGTRND